MIVDCDYCGARIMIDERVKGQSPKPAPMSGPAPAIELTSPDNPLRKVLSFVIALLFAVPLIFVLFGLLDKKATTPGSTKLSSTQSTPSTMDPPQNPAPLMVTPDKNLPFVNIEPRMSWDGPNDIEYFDTPVVDFSLVSEMTSEQVEKLVFKNRVAKLRVVINTDGQVEKITTISGHPLLVSAATESAKKSEFNSRSKPTTRVLTYTFRVIKN